MPRNGSGTMSITNAFTSGSTISSTAMNANFNDIATEITGSLPRNGEASMTGQMKSSSGTVAAPGIAFSSDTDCGYYRIGADNIGFSIGGVKLWDHSSAASALTGNLTVTGTLTTTGAIAAGGAVTIEGNAVYRVGGTDVALADGGTGAGTAAEARTNLGAAASGANSDITSLTGLSGAFGYATGAGGTVTQATNKGTGVTINKLCGQITTDNAALAAGAEVSFTVTNSTVAATDVVIVNLASGNTADAYTIWVDAVSAGSFRIGLANLSAGSLSQALVINFAVIKGVTS